MGTAPKGGRVQFRVLGHLEAVRDGEPVDLGSPRQRQVLSLLLLHVGEEVPLEHLLDALWEGDGRENAVYIAISRLRSALGADGQGLVTGDHGYRLAIDPESVDAVRFSDLVRHARALVEDDPAAARAALEEALGLWHGPAWSELRYVDAALPEIERIDELRTSATEDLLALRLDDGDTGAVLAEATALHREHPLRERPVHLMMEALYRTGRQAEALRVFRRFEQRLGEELGVEPSPGLRRLEEHVLVHDRAVQTPGGGEGTNPYQGLRAFREPDADRFFGRSRLVASVLEAIDAGETIVTLVGASGSGKSSVVRAGVVPALRGGALPGSGDWVVATMVPGSRPFVELEAALLRAVPRAPTGLSDQLHTPDTGILAAGLSLLPDDDRRLVVVVDQFEELFTLTTDPETRRRFLDAMVTAANDSRRRLGFLLTLRADRYHLALEEPRFAERFDDGVVHVPPMLPGELEAAAVEPARLAGADVDPALLTTLVADVGGRPGSLPLFQYALTELFDRGRPILSLADYEAAGGLHGAIGRRAESVFADFFEHERHACRHLFLRMVAITDEGVTRRRLTIAEAHALGLDEATVEGVVDAFVEARLVTTNEDPATHEATVEVAHEALFEAWHRFATWIDDAQQDLHRHTVLATAVVEWESAGRDPSYLWSGSRLADFQTWTDSSSFRLDTGERTFLQASAEAEAAREHRERRNRRASRYGPVLAVAIVALATVAGLALYRASVLGSVPAAKALVLDASVDDAATRLLLDGLYEAAEANDVAVETARVGTDSGPDINRAIEVGPDLVVIGRHAGEVFGPMFWEGVEIERRFPSSTVIVDLSRKDVRPTNYLTGRQADWVRVEFADVEAGILAGVLAAERTETGIVAFVDDQPGEDALLLAGFVWGVHEHHPDVDVVAVHTPVDGHPNLAQDEDAAKGAYTSTQQAIVAGADVIFEAHGEGDAGVAGAAANADRPVWVIGHDSDLHADLVGTDPAAADRVLASVIRRYDVAVTEVVDRLMNGESIDRLLLHVGNYGIDVSWRDTGNLTLAEASRLESTRGLLSDARHEAWDEPVFMGVGGASPLRDATRLAEADLTTAAVFLPDGPWIGDLGGGVVGQTLTVHADAEDAPGAGAWVAVGRMGAAVSSRFVSLPDIVVQPPWQTPHLWDTFEPRSWAIIPTHASDDVVVVLDRPGRWMIGMGVTAEEWILAESILPVANPDFLAYSRYQPVWQTFEVVESPSGDS